MDPTNWISRGLQPSTPPVENRERIVRVSVSSGTGERCAYCHKDIHAGGVAYEADTYVAAGLRTFHFHRVCLHLWEALLASP